MATTSIWSVKGWIGKVVIYAENPEKTENPKFFEMPNMTDAETQNLADVIDYAVNDEKTKNKKSILEDETTPIMERFVSGVNCMPENARTAMLKVKKQFGKEGGVVAYHGYQSFAEGEVTPEQAHEIGVKLAEILWGERHQVVVATHLDKAHHLHNHFVVNTVSFVDGKRYYRSEKDYYDMQTQSDNLCCEYGLSVLPNPKGKRSKHISEIKAEQAGLPTLRSMIKTDVDKAIAQSMTMKQFFDNLTKMHYEYDIKKYIYVRQQGRKYYYKLERNLGADYSYEGIKNRILEQSRPDRSLPEDYKPPKQYKLKGSLNNKRKITGFRALYFHYCYKLGIFPKNRPKSNKHVHWLFRGI